jgi:hypothetical protein
MLGEWRIPKKPPRRARDQTSKVWDSSCNDASLSPWIRPSASLSSRISVNLVRKRIVIRTLGRFDAMRQNSRNFEAQRTYSRVPIRQQRRLFPPTTRDLLTTNSTQILLEQITSPLAILVSCSTIAPFNGFWELQHFLFGGV